MKDFLLRAAVRKLHKWVGEKKIMLLSDIERLGGKPLSEYRSGQVSMCSMIKDEMRTLFAGLIDFDE